MSFKRKLIALALVAAGVSGLAWADANQTANAWFDALPSPATVSTNGTWSAIPDDVTWSTDHFVFEGSTSPLVFTANPTGNVNAYTNLIVSTTMKFNAAFKSLPTIESDFKAAVVIKEETVSDSSTYKYCVLVQDDAADPAANKWLETDLAATLGDSVEVVVTVMTNGANGTFVTYQIGDATALGPYSIVADNTTWSSFSYQGEGEVAALAGSFTENWLAPAGKTIPDDAKDAVEEWAKANGVKVNELEDTTVDSTTGLTKYEACMLGLAPGKAFAANEPTLGDSVIRFAVPHLEGAGNLVTYTKKLDSAAATTFDPSAGDLEIANSGRHVCTLTATVDGKSQSVTFGVQGFTGTSAIQYLPVPWTAKGDTGDIAVEDYLASAGLASGDRISVWADSEWETWQYDGSEWSFVPGTEKTTPTKTTLKRGEVVKFTGGSAKTVCTKGGYTADATSLTLSAGAFLVANPNGAEFKPTTLPTSVVARIPAVDSEGAYTALPSATYKQIHGTWYKIPLTGSASTVGSSEVISADTPFIVVSTNATTTINW